MCKMAINRILTILTLLVCIVNAEIQVYNVTMKSASHVANGSFYPAAVVKAQNQMVYVTFPRINNDTSIHLEWNDNQSCKILLARIGYLSTIVQSLGDGKIIVAIIEEKLSNQASSVGVRFYIIDFKNNCNYERFNVQFGSTIFYSYEPLSIVPYYESFDVFAKSSLHCKPKDSICLIRYSEEGGHLGISKFDFDTTEANFDLETIHPLSEYEASNGYVYISHKTSILRILDSNLKTIKEHKTPGYFITHSVLNNDIGYCTKTYDTEDSVECLKIDSRLKIKSRSKLTDANYFGTRKLYNLLDGTSLMVSLSLSKGRVNSLVKRLDVDGKLSEATLFQYECQSLDSDPPDYFTELKGGVYCFSYACRYGLITHCTSLPSQDRLPSYLT